MRTPEEIFAQLLTIAREDERIRACMLCGSRANPMVKPDKYQDYDIVYFVNDVTPFYNNTEWIKQFGELIMLQMPELMNGAENGGKFIYLMLFNDGVRIDLSFESKDSKYIDDGEPVIVLLDKDGILPPLGEPNDRLWWVKPPQEQDYFSVCNNFWWCLNNVAKGIARDELPYAMWMYNCEIRESLEQMTDWYIGVETRFTVSTGKHGKLYKKYLSPELYQIFIKTYSSGDYPSFWDAIFTACDLFRTISKYVGEHLGYTYIDEDDKNMMEYLITLKAESEGK